MTLAVAAVVVTHNSAAVIDKCLRSLENVAEIVVVDNGSADDTCRVVQNRSGVRMIANPDNRGFAAAANQGARATVSPLVLFVNPDVTLVSDLRPLCEEVQADGVGAAAGRLMDEHGRTQAGFNVRALPTAASLAFEALLVNRIWPSNPVNRRYRCLDLDYEKTQDVEQPAGAFLLVRRDVLERVGFWDERFYPVWFEDVDLCRRIGQAGYRIRYVPDSRAEHQGAHSVAQIPLDRKQLYWYGSLLTYADKHFSPAARAGMRLWVALGALLRMVGAAARGEHWQSYSRVVGLALRRPTEARQVQPHVLT